MHLSLKKVVPMHYLLQGREKESTALALSLVARGFRVVGYHLFLVLGLS